MDDRFVREPHWITHYLERSDMNMTQSRIFHVVKRMTFGFHEEEAYCTQSYLAKRTDCNQRQIARELKKMVEKGILLERFEGKKRWLKINPDISKMNHQNAGYVSLDISGYDYSDIVDYDYLDTHIKKLSKETYLKKDNNNTSILTNTMAVYYLSNYDSGYKEDIEQALEYYYDCYKKVTGKTHPKLKPEQLYYAYEQIESVASEGYGVEDIMYEFFTTVKETDYNLNHFVSDGIIHTLKERCK